jgi:hypothetical protein
MRKGSATSPFGVGGGGIGGGIAASCEVSELVIAWLVWQSATSPKGSISRKVVHWLLSKKPRKR